MQKLHIQLEDNQKIWFTSDLHLGHRNVIRFCNRPWENEKEMGKALIENWNNTVGDNDIVFVLGDTFWFNDSMVIKKVLSKLKGKDIYILPGNHDDFDHYYRVDDPRIHLCCDIVVVWITEENQPKREVWLSHYPMMTWPHRENGAYQFFKFFNGRRFCFFKIVKFNTSRFLDRYNDHINGFVKFVMISKFRELLICSGFAHSFNTNICNYPKFIFIFNMFHNFTLLYFRHF